VRAESSIVSESIHRRKDGSTFPVEVSIKYVELDRSYLVVVARDITERKKAEDALRESGDRYRDLVEHSEDLVCTHDLNARLLSVNPAAGRLLGYEIDELLSIPMRELIAPESRSQFDQYLERIKARRADSGFLCVVTKDGRRRVWEYRNTLRSEGVPYPVVRGMAHDVTERKQAQDALRQSEQRMRLFIEHAPAVQHCWIGKCATLRRVAAGARTMVWEIARLSGCLTTNFSRKYQNVGKRRIGDVWPGKSCARSATASNELTDVCNGFDGNCTPGMRKGKSAVSRFSPKK
jgi:PAS domain S-box-containing protein